MKKVFIATVTVDGYVSTINNVPEVIENMYYTENGGVNVTMAKPLPYIDANYSVASGRTVKFSKGNLQYNKSTGYFSFMDHQYGVVEVNNQNVGEDYADQNIVSLFGWGTSGWNNNNFFYQPYNTSKSQTEPYTNKKGFGYGPTNGQKYNFNLEGDYANADWGVYNKQSNQNKIVDGGDNAWRTLTGDEWIYLFRTRTASTVNGTENARYTHATINTDGTSVNGVILFPDTYKGGNPSGVTWGTINAVSEWGTKCTVEGWSALEAAGCVFLPTAGSRLGTAVSNVGDTGIYWSSTEDVGCRALGLKIRDGILDPEFFGARFFGYSVRLVCDVE